jgi:hypothetical protein
MKKIIALIGIVALIAIGWTAWYAFNKPHRSLDESQMIRVQADSLFLAFQQDETTANAAYLDKALEVSGMIAEIKTNQQGQTVLVLDSGDPMGGIVCTLTRPAEGLVKSQQVIVRGFCSGYLSDVVLRDGILVNP